MTPQMPRPAPRAITSVCSTVTADEKNAIEIYLHIHILGLEKAAGFGSLLLKLLCPFIQKRFFFLGRAADLDFDSGKFFFQPQFQLMRQVFFDMESVLWVKIRQIFVVGVACDVILIRQKGTDAAQLEANNDVIRALAAQIVEAGDWPF